MTTANSASASLHSRSRLDILDVLRGLAALAVCLFHLQGEHLSRWPLIGTLFSHGYLGVYAFFVISGYVIPLSLHGKIVSGIEYRHFLHRRFLRLYPVYVVAVIFTVALWYGSSWVPGFQGNAPSISPFDYLVNFTLTAGVANQPWILVVSWTLAIEAQFYVLIGLSIPLFRHQTFVVRYATLLAWAFMAFVSPDIEWVTSYGPIFGLGIALYMRSKSLLGRSALGGYILIAFLIQTRNLGWSVVTETEAWSSINLTSYLVSVVTMLAIVIAKDFRSAILVNVGHISYSLYLVHVPIGGRVVNLSHRLGNAWWIELLAMITAIAFSMAVAQLFYRFIEAPSHRWARAVRVSER
ncbi:acyltransferase family protein [Synoicihabitans lomoniglobus]|uniref:Acyltransferase n=1 Tax=Synoicihabitans lomoniglobus TaxID=2909285 RepID=A0AAF0I3Y6_9BACT|nr:acyltransferase [Opitutaceae bacterium LMO-M01]WED67317.1 acyltransferase [Opitutaceae bacterium LMO-M01]